MNMCDNITYIPFINVHKTSVDITLYDVKW